MVVMVVVMMISGDDGGGYCNNSCFSGKSDFDQILIVMPCV